MNTPKQSLSNPFTDLIDDLHGFYFARLDRLKSLEFDCDYAREYQEYQRVYERMKSELSEEHVQMLWELATLQDTLTGRLQDLSYQHGFADGASVMGQVLLKRTL